SNGGKRLARGTIEATAQPPASPAESHVCHGGKSCLIGAKREQQVRHAVGVRQGRIRRLDAVAMNAPASRPYEHGTRLPGVPGSKLAWLDHQPGALVECSDLVVDQVS